MDSFEQHGIPVVSQTFVNFDFVSDLSIDQEVFLILRRRMDWFGTFTGTLLNVKRQMLPQESVFRYLQISFVVQTQTCS